MSYLKFITCISLGVSVCFISGANSLSCQSREIENRIIPASSPGEPDKETKELLKYLKNLEDRFFFHSYDHDPLEKRIERIELLVFGEAKYGTIQERLTGLKTRIDANDREAASDMKRRNERSKKDGDAPQHYPIMNTLEWKILKKTYREEPLETRLDRLENKLFGKTAPAMSYRDRIDRLKKIVGINITSLSPENSSLPQGPLPRAGKTPLLIPFSGRNLSELNPNSKSFQDDFEKQFMKDMPNMMKYMDERLKNFFESSPNGYQFSPSPSIPHTVPKSKPKVTIPPYADPNSI